MKLTELKINEMKNISGGWNLVEYIAMGIGYLDGRFSKFKDFDLSSAGSHWTGA